MSKTKGKCALTGQALTDIACLSYVKMQYTACEDVFQSPVDCLVRLLALGGCRCSNIRSWKDSDRWLAAAQGLRLSAEQKQNFMGYRLTCLDTLKKYVHPLPALPVAQASLLLLHCWLCSTLLITGASWAIALPAWTPPRSILLPHSLPVPAFWVFSYFPLRSLLRSYLLRHDRFYLLITCMFLAANAVS